MGQHLSCFNGTSQNHPPPLVGATDEDVADEGDGRKNKKKVCRWWKKLHDERKDETDERDGRKNKKKECRWWKKLHDERIDETADERDGRKNKKKECRWWKKLHDERKDETADDSKTDDGTFLQKEVHQEALASDLVSTSEEPKTPVLTNLCRSVSGWSVDSCQTPLLPRTDSLVNLFHTRVCSGSHVSVDVVADIIKTSVSTESDWELQEIMQDINKNVNFKFEKINSCRYKVGEKLGEGGFGAIYEGIRGRDRLKVTLKYVTKTTDMTCISIPGHPEPIPLEIALLILVNQGPSVPEIIQLLDWEDQPDRYVMVLERFAPCMNLLHFLCFNGGRLSEAMAQIILLQVTKAAKECINRGVFHQDIKLENLLVNPNTLDVKLIDFGCGKLLTESGYDEFIGTKEYCCPEFIKNHKFHGEPSTVWTLGLVLYTIICGIFPSRCDEYRIKKNKFHKAGISKECCSLIQACLQKNPKNRIQLDQIFHHEWFQITVSADIPQTAEPDLEDDGMSESSDMEVDRGFGINHAVVLLLVFLFVLITLFPYRSFLLF